MLKNHLLVSLIHKIILGFIDQRYIKEKAVGKAFRTLLRRLCDEQWFWTGCIRYKCDQHLDKQTNRVLQHVIESEMFTDGENRYKSSEM